MNRTRPGHFARRVRRRVGWALSPCALAIGGVSCGATDPSDMPWPPTGDWQLATSKTVVQLTFGASTRKCTRVAGSFGDYDDCETRIPVSGHVRELADGRDITLKGAAIDKNGFVIYAAPVTNDGGEASTVVGCATVGYEFWGTRASPDIEGDLTVICYSKLIAGRTLISADEILWQRSEHARLVRR